MSFREVPQPFRSQFAIPFEDGPAFITPPFPLLSEELAYWYDERRKLPQTAVTLPLSSQQPHMNAFAEVVFNNLLETTTQGAAYAQPGKIHNHERINRWYAQLTTLAGFSRLWREAVAGVVETSSLAVLPSLRTDVGFIGYSPLAMPKSFIRVGPEGQADLLADLLDVPSPIEMYGHELRKFGLLLRPELFESAFGVEQPSQGVKWLEGDTVFVEAQTPADPSIQLEDAYFRSMDDLPAKEEFVTARGHLKLEAWPPEWYEA